MKTLPLLCCVAVIILCISIQSDASDKKVKGKTIQCCINYRRCLRCPRFLLSKTEEDHHHKAVRSVKFKKLIRKCKMCLSSIWFPGGSIPLPGV